MAVDQIPYQYRGTMRDLNGNLFDVDWVIVPDDTPVFPLAHAFTSGFWPFERLP